MQISNYPQLAEEIRQIVRLHLAQKFADQGQRVGQQELDRLVADICVSIAAGSVAALNSAPLMEESYQGYTQITIDPNSAHAAALFGKVPETVGSTSINGQYAEAAFNRIEVKEIGDVFKWS
ncbi:hypothetical protein IQ250_04565 [Pseudanabaenaceae cyanobacterium LEGE 13415]|nr:hypothetical protein [Pseudanabaenaceae cyanobacterium LEGE 13415]